MRRENHWITPKLPIPPTATTTPAPTKQSCDWWTQWPDALIGSPVPPHLICLDLDPRKGGTVAAFREVFGEPADTEFVMSGRGDGGIHLFYLRPKGFISCAQLREVLPGVDIKLDTGYTILPPSLHPDTGMPYQWGGPSDTHASPKTSGEWCNINPTTKPRPDDPTPGALEGILRRVAARRTPATASPSGPPCASWRTTTPTPPGRH